METEILEKGVLIVEKPKKVDNFAKNGKFLPGNAYGRPKGSVSASTKIKTQIFDVFLREQGKAKFKEYFEEQFSDALKHVIVPLMPRDVESTGNCQINIMVNRPGEVEVRAAKSDQAKSIDV